MVTLSMRASNQVNPMEADASGKGQMAPRATQNEPGPITKRSPRDILFLILFLLFWAGMFVITGFAIAYGDFRRLSHGTDSYGNLCGNSGNSGFDHAVDASALPYLFFSDPSSSSALTLCVSQCPNAAGNAYGLVCKYGITPAATSGGRATQVSNGDCFWPMTSTAGNASYSLSVMQGIDV